MSLYDHDTTSRPGQTAAGGRWRRLQPGQLGPVPQRGNDSRVVAFASTCGRSRIRRRRSASRACNTGEPRRARSLRRGRSSKACAAEARGHVVAERQQVRSLQSARHQNDAALGQNRSLCGHGEALLFAMVSIPEKLLRTMLGKPTSDQQRVGLAAACWLRIGVRKWRTPPIRLPGVLGSDKRPRTEVVQVLLRRHVRRLQGNRSLVAFHSAASVDKTPSPSP